MSYRHAVRYSLGLSTVLVMLLLRPTLHRATVGYVRSIILVYTERVHNYAAAYDALA